MPSWNWSSKRILITGASSGIGLAIAKAAATAGAFVIGTARDENRLEQLCHEIQAQRGRIVVIPADITVPEDRKNLAETIWQRFGGLDVLVNNAGIGAVVPFVESDPETLRRVFEVNFFATAELTRLCLPMLGQVADARLVNVSSVLGRRAIPDYGIYCASKFALQGWSDAIRAELSKTTISVLVVNPGPTESQFSQNLVEQSREPDNPIKPISAEFVASKVIRAIASGQAEVTTGFSTKLLILANRLVPRLVDWYFRRKVRARYAEEIAWRNQPKVK